MDNFEQLIGDPSSELLAEMLTAARGLKLLITSRERLNQLGEQVYPVGGIPLPCIDGLDWAGDEISARKRMTVLPYSCELLGAQTRPSNQIET